MVTAHGRVMVGAEIDLLARDLDEPGLAGGAKNGFGNFGIGETSR